MAKLLSEVIVQSWRHDLKYLNCPAERRFSGLVPSINFTDYFFIDEFAPITGMDILRNPVNRDAGYTVFKNDRTSALILRYEDIERGLAAGLSALTGRPGIKLIKTNLSAEKAYADFYRDFRASFRVPADLCSVIYEQSPYIRHFYSDADIVKFKQRWSDSGLPNRTS